MALSDLFAQNLFVRWLTGNRTRYDLAVSMAGVKLGERILQIGCADAGLLAALGAKVGYTGRACGVDVDPDVAARAGRIAERSGVLVETTYAPHSALPYDPDAFDVVILRSGGAAPTPASMRPAIAEALRVLRPGGRCIVVADLKPRGASRSRADRSEVSSEAARLLSEPGFGGARVLAEREGLTFVEALKPRRP